MIVSKAPMRISLFGGSTDYESFYKKHGSIIIGTSINKYAYNTIRYRPSIVGKESIVTYSQIERVDDIRDIRNPLIRETLRYYKVWSPIELNFASDIPTRTGLGGSSSCCVSLANSICCLTGLPVDKRQICMDAIKIEREILKEAGGIQDQIWACYGGFNLILIEKDGTFSIRRMPITKDFKDEFESSMVLIYTNKQRTSNEPSKSQDEKDKKKIMVIARQALEEFINEDIESIGKLLHESWKEKRALSPIISNLYVDHVINTTMKKGAFGAKLLGGGDGGFVLAICDRKTKKKIQTEFKDKVVNFRMETDGLTNIRI